MLSFTMILISGGALVTLVMSLGSRKVPGSFPRLCRRLIHFTQRVRHSGSQPPSESQISSPDKEVPIEKIRYKKKPNKCSVLLFPGQGSQFVGMGRGLLKYGTVKDMFAVSQKILGYDLLSMCLHGPAEELMKTVHCQPAIFVTSLAAVEKLNHENPHVSNIFSLHFIACRI